MTDNSKGLALAASDGFENSSREELEAYAEILGVKFHPNCGDDTLRNRLLENLGQAPREIPNEPDDEEAATRKEENAEMADVRSHAEPLSLKELFALNLTPDGKWQGRRRRIMIQRPVESPKARAPHACQWGRSMITIPLNKAVSVPYPFYHILKNANYKELEQKTRIDEDGVPHRVNIYHRANRFSLSDMDDDERTSHLPVSQNDQFRRIVEATDMLRDQRVTDRMLLMIARRLRLRLPRQAGRDEIRDTIMRKLGYDTMLMDFGEEEVA